jgi:hypothetical protein
VTTTQVWRAMSVTCVLGAACSRPLEAPQPKAATHSFATLDEPALQYSGSPTSGCPQTPLAGRVFGMVAHRAAESHKTTPQPDGRLCAVAASLATLMVEGAPPPQPAVEFALSQAGIVEPVPHFMVLVGDPAGIDALVREFETRLLDLPTTSMRPRMGVGVAPRPDGAAVVGLILQDSFVQIEPVPRAIPIGKNAQLSGRVAPPYKAPAIYVTDASGRVTEIAAKNDSRDFNANINCERSGRLQIEIMGASPVGPTVLANFPVWCGVTPPTMLQLAPAGAAVTDAAAAEREIFAMANSARAHAGLQPLKWHDGAAAVARAHSVEMRD